MYRSVALARWQRWWNQNVLTVGGYCFVSSPVPSPRPTYRPFPPPLAVAPAQTVPSMTKRSSGEL